MTPWGQWKRERQSSGGGGMGCPKMCVCVCPFGGRAVHTGCVCVNECVLGCVCVLQVEGVHRCRAGLLWSSLGRGV